MARIRTIKPEFPHSESMGMVSRDARLLFIMLWTLVDDSGITRGNSRMLASLLFPYDDDAPSLIEGWLDQLEKENCIVRYKHEGQTYLQICNWLNHQKIDKPTPSKLPSFDSFREDSRIISVGKEGKGSVSIPPTPNGVVPQADRKITFPVWLEAIKAKGEKPISNYRPVWEYAEQVGLPDDWIHIAWLRFLERYRDSPDHRRKRYIDWRMVFLRAVKDNWFKLWYAKDGQMVLTTVGVQADLATREAA